MQPDSYWALPPLLFLVLFPLLWVVVTALLSWISGWSALATRFRAPDVVEGERFRFVSGSLGSAFPVNYNNCLFVTLSPRGVGISILLLFRLRAPPLFIPWSQVESVAEQTQLFGKRTELRLRDSPVRIRIRGAAGAALLEAYSRNPARAR